jgi:hypothetical protein
VEKLKKGESGIVSVPTEKRGRLEGGNRERREQKGALADLVN